MDEERAMRTSVEIGHRLLAHRSAIAAATIRRYSLEDLQRGARFGIDQARFEQYAGYDIAYLAYSLQTGQPGLLEHYVRWLLGARYSVDAGGVGKPGQFALCRARSPR